jgi:hypothetical protein
MKIKKTNLIWGIVCLVLAAILEVLNLVLPPDSMIFYVGEQNMRWVPVVVLTITGIVLLFTARKKADSWIHYKLLKLGTILRISL